MKVKHIVTLDSEYELVEVEPISEDSETWTYLIYTDKAYDTAIELKFDVTHGSTIEIENLKATTVMYDKRPRPCPICRTSEMEICPEYEAEKEKYETGHAFLHDCGLDEDEWLLFAMELYVHDHLEQLIDQEEFNDSFFLEEKRGKNVLFYETNSAVRFRLNKNEVLHVIKQGEELEECPFCELDELAVYGQEEARMKCSVLSRNIPYLRKLIERHPEQPSAS